jgi:hypothetical protein
MRSLKAVLLAVCDGQPAPRTCVADRYGTKRRRRIGMNASRRDKVQIGLKGEHSSGQFVMSGVIADRGRWDELDGLYGVRRCLARGEPSR